MESPARYTPYESKKRVFPGSSSSCLDPDVVEISPPMNWSSSKSRSKRKEVAHHEVISVDPDDDPDFIVPIDEEVDSSYKGKSNTFFPLFQQSAKQSANTSGNNMATTNATDGVQSSENTAVQGAHDSLDIGFSDHDFVSEEAYMDWLQDGSVFVDEYAFLQAQFDNIDIPTGIEVPVPWFTDLVENQKKVGSISSSNYPFSEVQLDTSESSSLRSRGENWTSLSGSSRPTQVAAKQPCVTKFSSQAFPMSSPNKNKSNVSTISHILISKMATSSRVPWYSPGFSSSDWKYSVSGSSEHYPAHNDLGSVEVPSHWDSYSKRSYPYNFQNKISDKGKSILTSPEFDTSKLPHSVNALKSVKMGSFSFYQQPFPVDGIFKESSDAILLSPEESLGIDGAVNPAEGSTVPSGSTSNTEDHVNQDDFKNPLVFKQFDTVEDCSDHHYSKNGSPVTQQLKKWAKAIQEEWKILEKDLPDTIFVRVYESRMDLMRAVIVGAQGTPYHDGLFFFDIFFPSNYPSVPPHVYYHSGGLRINPNLYNTGKVCLSLLNTWSGRENEKWIPNVSTMLQVLVSIQALILNEKPYFNEPGCAKLAGSTAGEVSSQNYSENTFILSLKTMVYTMRKPPKHFEELVVAHFCRHAQDILGACKAYIEGGVQVGSDIKGGVKNVQTTKCSPHFKATVASHITMLVHAFVKIGAKDCDKFLSLAQMAGGLNQGLNSLDNRYKSIPPWLKAIPTMHDKIKYEKYK